MAAVRAHGRRAAAVVGDLSLPATALRLVDEAEAALGPVDVLVNNAGTIRRAPAAEHSDEDWDLVLAVNLSSPFRLSREVGQAAHRPRGAREDRQRRLAPLLPGRDPRPLLRRGQGRPRPADEGARERVGAEGDQRQRHRPRLHEDRQHRRRSAPTRTGAGRSSSGSPPGAGASRRTSPGPSSSSPRPPATTSPATSSSSTAAGWRARGDGPCPRRAETVAALEACGVVAVIRLKDAGGPARRRRRPRRRGRPRPRGDDDRPRRHRADRGDRAVAPAGGRPRRGDRPRRRDGAGRDPGRGALRRQPRLPRGGPARLPPVRRGRDAGVLHADRDPRRLGGGRRRRQGLPRHRPRPGLLQGPPRPVPAACG